MSGEIKKPWENEEGLLGETNSKIEKYLKNEFIQYRTELANLGRRVSFLEENYNSKLQDLEQKIFVLEKNLSFVKENIYDFCTKLNINNQFTAALNARLETETETNSNNIRSYDELITTVKKLHKHMKQLIKNTGSFQGQSNTLIAQMQDNISNNHIELDRKIKALKESLISQLNCQNKEIDNFESHLVNEFNGFVKIVKGTVSEQVGRNKIACDYNTDDIKLLRYQKDYLELTINKLRQDFNNSIKDTENYILDKVDRLSQRGQIVNCPCMRNSNCSCAVQNCENQM